MGPPLTSLPWRVVLPLDAPAVSPAEPARAPYRAPAASEAPAWYLVARRSYQALWLEKLLPGVPLEEPREPYGADPARSRWLGPHPTGLSLAHLCAQLRASPEAVAALASLEEEEPASSALQLAEQAVGETEGSELA